MWITRANVSTRNNRCPFDLPKPEKYIEPEIEGVNLEAPIP